MKLLIVFLYPPSIEIMNRLLYYHLHPVCIHYMPIDLINAMK